MDEQKLLELIDACRPGSRDVQEPELAPLAAELAQDPVARELYQRVQRVDTAIQSAFHEVPVPEGLAERLLARLQPAATVRLAEVPLDGPLANVTVRPAARDAALEQAGDVQERGVLPMALPARRVSRRFWLAGGLGAALAAGLSAVWLSNPMGGYTPDRVLEDAVAFHRESAQPEIVRIAPPRSLPLSTRLVAFRGTRCRTVNGILGRTGVAYDWRIRGAKATLYAVPMTVPGLRNSPPATLGAATGDLLATAWQEGAVLYILVLEGTDRDYQKLLRPQRVA